MRELLEASFSLVNLPFTILLLLVLIYWLIAIVGLVGVDLFDIDLDTDADLDLDTDVEIDTDVDVDADADVDVDADADAAGDLTATSSLDGLGVATLRFFHLGTVPFMILFSVLITCLWALSVTVNDALGNQSLLFALVLDVPIIIASLFLTKILTLPLKTLFERLRKERHDTEVVQGRLCTAKTRVDGQRGQVLVEPERGAPVLLNARTRGDEVVERGASAVVVEQDRESRLWIVSPVP